MNEPTGKSADAQAAGDISVPNFEVMREIGSGANGTVYEAHDIRLDRRVALKVWNFVGAPRAEAEIRKIASLNHPLIVSTYLFGTESGHPYAVMELVPGVSGKEWIRSSPSVESRVEVWRMYERALRHIYASELIHGDPHLGNLIVYYDKGESVTTLGLQGEPAVAMKLADTGTSEVWADEDKFEARESRLIRETAGRIFKTEQFGDLADGLDGLKCRDMLAACGAIVSCISTLNGQSDDFAAQVANAVVEIALETPVFDIDELSRQAFKSQTTHMHRVVTRLNGALRGRSKKNWWEGEEEITSETKRLYGNIRKNWQAGNPWRSER